MGSVCAGLVEPKHDIGAVENSSNRRAIDAVFFMFVPTMFPSFSVYFRVLASFVI
jgi:hypothetical protein